MVHFYLSKFVEGMNRRRRSSELAIKQIPPIRSGLLVANTSHIVLYDCNVPRIYPRSSNGTRSCVDKVGGHWHPNSCRVLRLTASQLARESDGDSNAAVCIHATTPTFEFLARCASFQWPINSKAHRPIA
jgi:hypothetical protein